MKQLTAILAFVLMLSVLNGCTTLQSPGGVIKGAEIATTVANLDPLFDQTVTKIDGNWSQFTPEERVVLERSYRKLLSVRDTVKSYTEKNQLAEIIIDLSRADLIYASLKDAYLESRTIIFAKLDTFSYYDQAELMRLDTRMRNLDYAIYQLRQEGEQRDITPEIKSILLRTVEIIQLYRMAKDPLGLTYGDRPEQTPL